MIDFKVFSTKFPNWEIIKKSSNELIVQSKTSDNRDEFLVIIDFLSEFILKEKWSFKIVGYTLELNLKEKRKYKRMYTSGCFDIFHYGHLNILKKSKELCDYLIVGVSTDELIAKEKGKKPIIPFEERMKVIQAIGLVDEVIAQEDKNKQKIVDQFQIDAISVGDDWRGRYPQVSCKMEYFPYTANVSSTILKEALKLTTKSS